MHRLCIHPIAKTQWAKREPIRWSTPALCLPVCVSFRKTMILKSLNIGPPNFIHTMVFEDPLNFGSQKVKNQGRVAIKRVGVGSLSECPSVLLLLCQRRGRR